jgi:hypothetical protein
LRANELGYDRIFLRNSAQRLFQHRVMGGGSFSAAVCLADGDFNQAALHPADPIKCHVSTQRTQTPDSVDIAHHRAAALDPLENNIGGKALLRHEAYANSVFLTAIIRWSLGWLHTPHGSGECRMTPLQSVLEKPVDLSPPSKYTTVGGIIYSRLGRYSLYGRAQRKRSSWIEPSSVTKAGLCER